MSTAVTAGAVTAELAALCERLPGMDVTVEADATGWAVLVTHEGGGLVQWGARAPDPSGLRTALLSEGLDSSAPTWTPSGPPARCRPAPPCPW